MALEKSVPSEESPNAMGNETQALSSKGVMSPKQTKQSLPGNRMQANGPVPRAAAI